jgi:hypothetical protein
MSSSAVSTSKLRSAFQPDSKRLQVVIGAFTGKTVPTALAPAWR